MKCPKCGRESNEFQTVCTFCGNPISNDFKMCYSCGKVLKIDDEICPRCGKNQYKIDKEPQNFTSRYVAKVPLSFLPCLMTLIYIGFLLIYQLFMFIDQFENKVGTKEILSLFSHPSIILLLLALTLSLITFFVRILINTTDNPSRLEKRIVQLKVLYLANMLVYLAFFITTYWPGMLFLTDQSRFYVVSIIFGVINIILFIISLPFFYIKSRVRTR